MQLTDVMLIALSALDTMRLSIHAWDDSDCRMLRDVLVDHVRAHKTPFVGCVLMCVPLHSGL